VNNMSLHQFKRLLVATVWSVVVIAHASAQPPRPDHGAGGPPPPDGPPGMSHGPRQRSGGRWWMDSGEAQRLGLSPEQQTKLDVVYQHSRLRLIDLSANLQKDEATLEPMLEVDRPDESKVLAQIDRVAQDRAELEKANARMLLGLRNVLTPEQWKKLQAEDRPRDNRPPGGPRFD
jgi:Spy/CpxP family protein refolding chaperone